MRRLILLAAALALLATACDDNMIQVEPPTKISEHCLRITDKLAQPGLTAEQYRRLKAIAHRDGCKIPGGH